MDNNYNTEILKIKENSETKNSNQKNNMIANQVNGTQPQNDPVVNQTPGVIIANQTAPIIVESSPVVFRKTPISMTCPYCGLSITTEIDSSLNCLIFLMYLYGCCCAFLWLFPLCLQLCTNKEICNCCDVTHRCPNCRRVLGKYFGL